VKFTPRFYILTVVFLAAVAVALWRYMVAPNVTNTSVAGPVRYTPIPPGLDNLCSTSDAAMVADRGLDDGAITFARANGYYTWCIPEYDDDQRFSLSRGDSAKYGPIAHVLAFPGLDSLSMPDQFNGQYIQVAIVDVEGRISDDLPAPYRDLGLTGLDCLYLQHYNKFGGLEQWFTALMVPADKNSICPPTPTASNHQTALDVRPDPSYSSNATDYPPTTRFIEGDKDQTLIGVKCGNLWCVVGPPGFGPVPQSAHANPSSIANSIPQNTQGNIKGWFDDQVLGIPDGSGKFGIRPKVRASAVPDAALGSLKVADFMVTTSDTESYKVVGRTYFPDKIPSDSKYVTHFGFSQGTNVVALRAELRPGKGLNPKLDTLWFAQVTDAQGHVTSDIATHRTDHRIVDAAGNVTLPNIPATMRWRWFDSDEDLWVECDVGCCLVGKGQ
jgi:hypothetical protein